MDGWREMLTMCYLRMMEKDIQMVRNTLWMYVLFPKIALARILYAL